MDTNTSSAEDNPFAAPKQQPAGKVSVTLPTDGWLCRKMDGLNLKMDGLNLTLKDIRPEALKQEVCRGTSL